MYIYIIVAFIIFIYGAFSTIFHSTDIVGNIGKTYGEANLNLFGYLAYIDLIITLYPLYRLYKNRDLLKQIDFYVGWIILFISLILLQSLTLEFSAVGSVGTTLKLFLLPLIGKAGLWLLWLLTFLVSIVLLVDEIPDLSFLKDRSLLIKNYIHSHIKGFIDRFENPFFDKQSTEIMTTIVSNIDEISKSNSQIIAHQRLKRITDKGSDFIKKKGLIGNMGTKNFRLPKPILLKNSLKKDNRYRTINLRDILESSEYIDSKSPLTLALGRTIEGELYLVDLKKIPNLLIAGVAESGKLMGINGMILSLLYRNSPSNLKLIFIDTRGNFSLYGHIPHLFAPIIKETSKGMVTISNIISEIKRRYSLMAKSKAKDIETYNKNIGARMRLPYIVVIVEELGDLIKMGGRDMEYSIVRVAQMARISGVHLIIATQRPNIDVVTRLIKANFPSRLSYRVEQKMDSKVILDSFGADTLSSRDEALFCPTIKGELIRLQIPLSSQSDIEKVVEFFKSPKEM